MLRLSSFISMIDTAATAAILTEYQAKEADPTRKGREAKVKGTSERRSEAEKRSGQVMAYVAPPSLFCP